MSYLSQEEMNIKLHRYGYPWGPGIYQMDPTLVDDLTAGEDGPLDDEGNVRPCPDAMKNLDENNLVRKAMLRLYQTGPMAMEYQNAGIIAYSREPVADGLPGPATYEAMSVERCGCPDYGFMRAEVTGDIEGKAIGEGPWKGCHGVGDGHAAHFQYQNAPPSHMLKDAGDGETVFTKVLRAARIENAKMGLLCYYSGPGVSEEFHPPNLSSVQSRVSWTVGDGWIGLAIVGKDGMPCSQIIWIRYDNRFGSSYSIAQVIRGHVLLVLHEQTHNEGYGHTSSGIQAPVLRLETNPSWEGDPLESWKRRKFGGKPIPIPGGPKPPPDDDDDDGPKPPPPGDMTWSQIIAAIIKKLLQWIFKNVHIDQAKLKEEWEKSERADKP